jgi:chromosome segregation ATPase
MTRKQLTQTALFVAAFIGMGISIPSCPGDKAMQQQIDGLTQSNSDMTKKLQMLDSQNKGLASDLQTQKQVLTQLASTAAAQKEAIDNLYTSVKQLQARPAPAAKKAPAKKKKKKHSA